MADVLTEILAHKRGEVERARAARSLADLQSAPGFTRPRRDFYGAVTRRQAGRPNLIAEIKRSSPSAGLIQPNFDPVAIARQYEAGGAAALSVLTDEKYFGGRLEYIAQIKAVVTLPVLRKDFLVDTYQLYESRAAEADAILVIVDALEPVQVHELTTCARHLGLAVLLEVHSAASLATAIEIIREEGTRGTVLGINNRNLKSQQIDLATTEQLAAQWPAGWPFVAESGVKTRADVERLHAAGARALLVGETLMRSGQPEQTILELFPAGEFDEP